MQKISPKDTQDAVKRVKILSRKFKADADRIRERTLEELRSMMNDADRRQLGNLRKSMDN
jgi:hypothetical protein